MVLNLEVLSFPFSLTLLPFEVLSSRSCSDSPLTTPLIETVTFFPHLRTALDHACIRRPAAVRQRQGAQILRLPNVGCHCGHLPAVWDLLPDARGGQLAGGLHHVLKGR